MRTEIELLRVLVGNQLHRCGRDVRFVGGIFGPERQPHSPSVFLEPFGDGAIVECTIAFRP